MAKILPRDCPNCGKNFKPPKNEQKYCAEACGHEFKLKTHRAEINRMLAEGEIPTTRMEATLTGSRFYFTGRACCHGHVDVYVTQSKSCFTCEQISRKEQNKRKKESKGQIKPAVTESVQTSPIFLHILPDWRPVVVQRGVV